MLLKSTIYTCLFMLFYIAAGVLIMTFIHSLYLSSYYTATDVIYILAQVYKNFSFIFIFLYIMSGLFISAFLFFRKPFLYMEELSLAAKKLYESQSADISLPPELKEYELHLNNVKMKIIQNERAAKEAEQRKNDLVVYLAHDLKTPLTSVIGYLTLLRDEREISPELQHKYIAISLDKAERLEDLINEFFDITRFNLTSITLEKSNINLSFMLEQLVYEFKPMLTEKSLQCNLSSPMSIYLNCDGDKLQRVFDNLLRNAVNYSYPDSTIDINMDIDNNNIYIFFKNRGNTIPPEKLARIFEQFYRLDQSRGTKSGGVGLGLAIAKEIVELHGGSLTVSSFNENIIFKIILPRA